MIKKIAACVFTVGILGGLAYYSGSLYSEKAVNEDPASLRAPISASLQREIRESADRDRELLVPEQEQKMDESRQEASTEAEAVQAEAEPYLYYLEEEGGYVRIYEADRETIYEETEITMDMLPEELQSEIREGRGLRSIGELYDFLENYSS